ncbi:MAG: hypothetical protein H7287_05075 [Thermoleophilia bacterium]|nr:hypothetical protein [Thermoleophilia bacterium]
MDPKGAASSFYERARNWNAVHPEVPMGDLAQKVQVSAVPDAYAKWETEARTAVAAYHAST